MHSGYSTKTVKCLPTKTKDAFSQRTPLIRSEKHFVGSLMASSLFSGSSLSRTLYFASAKPKPNSIVLHRHTLLLRTITLAFFSNSSSPHDIEASTNKDSSSAPTSSEKRSLAVATSDLFFGLASRLFMRRRRTPFGDSGSVAMFENSTEKRKLNEEDIGTVMEDEIQPDVVWEQRVKDVEVERNRHLVTNPGFSFSAAGFLFPYHLGVAQFLIENGYIKESTPLAGASAGAIVCVAIASGTSTEEALKVTKILAEDCRRQGTAFRLGAVLRDALDKFLPEDAHIRCNGRVRVAVTQLFWRPRGLLVDRFDSREDLINAVFTSSFIPGYLAPRPATSFRNRLCMDGGLMLFMPPTSAAQTVRVCAFPTSLLRLEGGGIISPDCNPENVASPRQLFKWAFEPAEDDILNRLFEHGLKDAAVWAVENPAEKIVQEENPEIQDSIST